jgi:hypothetical protein
VLARALASSIIGDQGGDLPRLAKARDAGDARRADNNRVWARAAGRRAPGRFVVARSGSR